MRCPRQKGGTPMALKKFCRHQGCNAIVESGYCTEHQRDKRSYDQYRSSAHQRGYGHKWREARKIFLSQHPLCIDCEADGILTAATDVDHDIPHRGDNKLFWDRTNWRARCHSHHSQKTAREDGGFGRRTNSEP